VARDLGHGLVRAGDVPDHPLLKGLRGSGLVAPLEPGASAPGPRLLITAAPVVPRGARGCTRGPSRFKGASRLLRRWRRASRNSCPAYPDVLELGTLIKGLLSSVPWKHKSRLTRIRRKSVPKLRLEELRAFFDGKVTVEERES
jgi:hypothetical protein